MLYLGSDHRGYPLKEALKLFLLKESIVFRDVGTKSGSVRVDASDYALKVVKKIKKGDRGILLCGSGVAMSVFANRFRSIRAALVGSVENAKKSREDSDCNILVLSSEETFPRAASKILEAFLETKFIPKARYKRRIKKMEKYGSSS